MSTPNRSLWGIHFVSSSFHFFFIPLIFFIVLFETLNAHSRNFFMLHTCHTIGLSAPPLSKLRVALNCLGCQFKHQMFPVSLQKSLNEHFREGFLMSRRRSAKSDCISEEKIWYFLIPQWGNLKKISKYKVSWDLSSVMHPPIHPFSSSNCLI